MRLALNDNDMFLGDGASLIVEQKITASEASGQRAVPRVVGSSWVVPGTSPRGRRNETFPFKATSREGVGVVGKVAVFIKGAGDRACVLRATMVSLETSCADGTETAQRAEVGWRWIYADPAKII